MITVDLLLQAGFVLEEQDKHNLHHQRYYKYVKSEQGSNLYVIQITKVKHILNDLHFDYYAEAKFESEDGTVFQVEIMNTESIEQVLNFYARIFKSMQCLGVDEQ